MDIYLQSVEAVLVLGVMVSGTAFLRHQGIVPESGDALFADLITRVTLPALIFHALSHASLSWRYAAMTAALFAAEAVVFVLARLLAGVLKLERAQRGSFILASVFGSSALLGYALVAQLFPGSAGALAEAAVVSELGVGLPLFTAGVMIAIYYGSAGGGRAEALKNAAAFFRSPIFLSIVAGTLWSLAGVPVTGPFVSALFEGIGTVAGANTLLVALLVGVSLRFDSLKAVLPVAAASSVLKLFVLPLLTFLAARYFVDYAWQEEVLLVEAAMPSAMLGVAFAHRYGCDTALASKLVFATLLLSVITLPMTLRVLG